jgi:hypothetical protein
MTLTASALLSIYDGTGKSIYVGVFEKSQEIWRVAMRKK